MSFLLDAPTGWTEEEVWKVCGICMLLILWVDRGVGEDEHMLMGSG